MDPLTPDPDDPTDWGGDPAQFDAGHLDAPHLDGGPGSWAASFEPLPGEDADPGDPDDNLWVHDDGRIWDLGPAEVDTDADGIADSLTRNGPDGVTVYTDSDHDGQVDRITQLRSDGSYTASRLDPDSGTWVPTDSGRLD